MTISGLSEEEAKVLRRQSRVASSGGSLHAAERWMQTTRRTSTYSIGETPNPTLREEGQKDIAAGRAIFIADVPEHDLYGSGAFVPERMHLVTARPFAESAKETKREFKETFPQEKTS